MFDLDKKNALGKADKSRKGDIDEDIEDLVKLINSSADYYTNSSCSGRIVLQIPFKKRMEEVIFIKHSPVRFSEINKSVKKIPKGTVWLKEEPIILHISCRTIADAQKMLDIARSIGLKRSGIIGIKKKIVVEIIGSERVEAPIARDGKMLANDIYLKELVKEANKKLKKSKEKIELFYHMCVVIRPERSESATWSRSFSDKEVGKKPPQSVTD